MKNLILVMVLTLGTAGIGFAGNNPALTYQTGSLVTANPSNQLDEATPWHKGALHYPTGIAAATGAWYDRCPVTHAIFNSKHESEVALSNGKRIMLSWVGLKDTVEADLEKYGPYMY